MLLIVIFHITLVTISTATASVVPQLTLPVDTMDSHLHPTEAPGPAARTPYDHPLIIEHKLVNHPDKVLFSSILPT